ncbi:MAG: hypothetical protein M3Q39_13300 [Actinomycetota bacterium]|nr:hypothetical protein [Actinomycetota bacterium]
MSLDINEGASGDDLLEVVMDADLLADHELIQSGSPYREWCAPADLVNRHASIRLLPRDGSAETSCGLSAD